MPNMKTHVHIGTSGRFMIPAHVLSLYKPARSCSFRSALLLWGFVVITEIQHRTFLALLFSDDCSVDALQPFDFGLSMTLLVEAITE